MPFPLPFIPVLSYKTGGRKYGAARDGRLRKHAGCDLIAPRGTEIFAIDAGHVVERPQKFYRGTWQLAIRHPVGVVRYCEIEEEELLREYKVGMSIASDR
jgi:murein DD-endopeptidase MepM/ murein hydrolase activator NlpD